MVARQYDIVLVGLDPTVGSEMRKTRPCVVVSPDEMNRYLRTVQIAPMTSNTAAYPWRVPISFQRKRGMVALDQVRTVDGRRLLRQIGRASAPVIQAIKATFREILVD